MCGIAGIISPEKNSASSTQLMIAAISHRGPDGESFWSNDEQQVHFAHRRLAIIDLSATGCQPMHYLDRYSIIHNGEVYNYKEIRNTLRGNGYHFKSNSDTEVIMAAYDCWGVDCLKHFNGMFAFAIWDEREKQLFAARDRFGQKPFYYFFDKKKNQFAFASEMKALLMLQGERKINKKQMLLFLSLGFTSDANDSSSTFYDGILQLPPAHFLLFNINFPAGPGIHRYWDLDKSAHEKDDETAIEEFRNLFKSSVELTFNADVNVGTCLSGGLDSSSIAAVASKLSVENNSYKAFTAVFPGFEKDESSYSALVARQFGLEQFIVSPSGDDLVNDLEKFLWHQEQPVGSASAYVQYKVFELAKSHGIKVLLDGQGADETLAGYLKYLQWNDGGWKKTLALAFPSAASKFLRSKALKQISGNKDLKQELLNEYKADLVVKPVVHSLNDLLYFNTCVSGLNELLHYADRNSMAHGREVRLPFLDHRLVEFIASLSSHFKIRGNETKWILRKTMENILPREIVWRKDKVGFEPPQKDWMQNKKIEEMSRAAKKALIQEKYLVGSVLEKNFRPHHAYDSDSAEWRYMVAGLALHNEK